MYSLINYSHRLQRDEITLDDLCECRLPIPHPYLYVFLPVSAKDSSCIAYYHPHSKPGANTPPLYKRNSNPQQDLSYLPPRNHRQKLHKKPSNHTVSRSKIN